jgi:hypothetical protein
MNRINSKHGNWSDTDVVIATSIAPVEIEKQQAAIKTWIDLGFSVVSLNIQKEVDKLQPLFKDVHFYTVNRDASDKYCKPFVYVNDVLDYLRYQGSRIGGIVNSDIHLRAEKNLVPYIIEHSQNSVLFASRIDIDTAESKTGELYCYGFDAFFFDQKLIENYPICNYFCLGIPWWDYWIPTIALNKSLNPKCITNTFVYHIKHKINYSIKNWREVGVIFSQYYDDQLHIKLQHLYETNQIDRLDEELGPNMTYNLVQKTYRESQLIEYSPDYVPKNEVKSSMISLKSVNNEIQQDDSFTSKQWEIELYYESLIWSAWRFYTNKLFDKMSICLYQSLKYTSAYPSQCICDWIEKFNNFALESNLQFDSYTLSQIPEWEDLMYSLFNLTPSKI